MTRFNVFSTTPGMPPESELTENDARTTKGSIYRFNPAIEAAVDVAIGLGKPLLVAGEPGCGKTELGYAIARRMRIRNLYFFAVKSSSEATDLFYTYDAIRRFREAQLAEIRARAASASGGTFSEPEVGDFIKYRALGRAILDAHPHEKVAALLRGRGAPKQPGEPRRSVVVIDEIDKAPRDFTNDLLREIEDFSFRVPELQNEAGLPDATPSGDTIPGALKPIIVITSNEESQLPDAFLRRCVFLAIDFPDDKVLQDILEMHLGNKSKGAGTSLSGDDRAILLRVFGRLRAQSMQKNPGIAELVDAGRVLAARPNGKPAEEWLPQLAPALVKLKSDLEAFKAVLSERATSRPR
ncbi:AAA family ATPase [Bradyrhizobium yuanmingense]|uniref:AAA family ATPase n=1 Tax=Bradyrhizobium yuanmingense TaxID=108015 RepID=UPI0023B98DF0|nr:MoxR family ATPase [Bradyrhizobium yuanmingense]MDF0495732.1 MoxR family ATPase [Bradyrhizobium yuanmingense]